MPLVTFDVVRGRTDAELRVMLDACHEAVVEAFAVPLRDRYQIVTEHEASQMVIEDTGLGFTRTESLVVIKVFTRPRSREAKVEFYRLISVKLERMCGLAPTDIIVSMIGNTDEDWSFGMGQAQFLNGNL